MSTKKNNPYDLPYDKLPNYDSVSWDDTEKGGAALKAYNDAQAAVNNQNPFTFSQNNWLNSVKQNIQNYGNFSYDMNKDALYQQAVDRYKQMGKLAMQDTMGQAAAMTGGYGSSYAQSVGQQAYNAQLDKLNDVGIELYNMALDRYKMGKEDLYNQYGLLMKEYEREYGLYSDEYNKLLDALGIASDSYYKGGEMYYNEQDNKNAVAGQVFGDAMSIWSANQTQSNWEKEYALKTAETPEVYGPVNTTTKTEQKDKPIKVEEPTKDYYADWDYGDWEAYFAQIRQSEGKSAAEQELNYFTSKGLIPQKYVAAGASGARGGKMGH